MIVGVPGAMPTEFIRALALLPKKTFQSCISVEPFRALSSRNFLRVVAVFYLAVSDCVPRPEKGRSRCRVKAYAGQTVADTRTDRAVRRVYANLFFFLLVPVKITSRKRFPRVSLFFSLFSFLFSLGAQLADF